MEENSDNQMETDVSSTTQDLPSPQEVATTSSSMEVTVEVAETTMDISETTVEVEELKEEPQDQSINSNTPEAESSTVSPKQIVIDSSPEAEDSGKTLVYKSPQKTVSLLNSSVNAAGANHSPSILPSSPTKPVRKSPVKIVTPVKLIISNKSPAKVVAVDKSPLKVGIVDKSTVKVINFYKSPEKVIILDESPTKETPAVKSPAKSTEETTSKEETSKLENTKLEEVKKLDQEVSKPETLPEKPEATNVTTEEIVIEPSTDSQTGSETPTSEVSEREHNKSLSRELKSLINSAKESKIISECTQLTSKTRKSRTQLDTSLSDAKKVTARRGSDNSQESNSSEKSDKSGAKRSMRSQNPEFVTKQKNFLNSVTGKKEEEPSDDEVKSKEPESTATPKKKSEEKIPEATGVRPDGYCWRCHWAAESTSSDKAPKPVTCSVCPRTYHFKCLTGPERSSVQSEKTWVCPECTTIMQAESSETRSPAMRKITLGMLCDLLKYALKRMMEVNGVEPFTSPVDRTVFPEYDKFVVHPMDLSLVRANIDGGYYGSTEAFAADVAWILHNSIIFNTLQSKLTAAARALLRSCRAEMGEVEACPECYAAAHARRPTWFTDVCSAPHILLWAKLKGFPYWPAKGMSVSIAGMVDVRFFGAHDRAWLPARDCYLYCEKDPNNFKAKRQDIIDSMQEAEEHIRNISRKFGKFVYPDYRVPFEPARAVQQLADMIPGYVPDSPKKTKPCPAALKNKRKSTAAIDDVTPQPIDKNKRKSMCQEPEPKAEALKNKRKSMCREPEPKAEALKNKRKSMCKEPEPKAEALKNKRKSMCKEPEPKAEALKNKRKSMCKEPEPKAEALKNKRKSTSQRSTSPRPKRKAEDETEEAGEDKKKSDQPESAATKEPETRKRRRSALEEAVVLTVMDGQDKRPRLDTSAATTEGSDKTGDAKDPTDKGPEKMQTDETSTPKTKDKEREGTPKTKSRGSTPKIVLRQVPKSKTSKSVEKAKTREKSSSTDKSSDEKTKKTKKGNKPNETESPKVIEKKNEGGKASPVPKPKVDQNKNTASPKTKDDDNTTLATIAKKKSGALNIPLLISNVRSLSKPTSSPKNKSDESEAVFTPSGDNVNMKEAVEKLQRLRNEGENNSLVGKVGVRAFARMTSPPADRVEVEVKAEPIDLDEDRQSEKIDLLNTFKLRPVNPGNLREVRINKPVPVKKACTKAVEVRPRAKKTFPQPRKADEGRSELNGKNSMVYIPIQPPVTSAPRPRMTAPAPRPSAPPVSTAIPAARPLPALGQAPPSVHTVPFITSVNGQWTFSLQPVMAVGQDSTSPPQMNGLDRPIPLPTSLAAPPPLLPPAPPALTAAAPALPPAPALNTAPGLIQPVQPPILLPTAQATMVEKTPDELPRLQQKPSAPFEPAAGEVPPPAAAGPVTAKINMNAVKMADFFRNLLQESLERLDDPRAQLAAARRQLEELAWRHQQQLAELRHNHELQITEMRTSFEKERARSSAEAARAAQAELDAAVKLAKTKQWCANCGQEAQFYCCWNTAYCDYGCQRAHWAQHHANCDQQRGKDGNDRTIPPEERLQPPELPKNSGPIKTVGGKVMTPRIAPIPSLAPAPGSKSSIIVSMVEEPGGNTTVKCVGTYKPPTTAPLLINKQIMNNEENGPKKVVTSGGYLIVGAGAPAPVSGPVVID